MPICERLHRGGRFRRCVRQLGSPLSRTSTLYALKYFLLRVGGGGGGVARPSRIAVGLRPTRGECHHTYKVFANKSITGLL